MNKSYYFQYFYSKNIMHFVSYNISKSIKSHQSKHDLNILLIDEPKNKLLTEAVKKFNYPSILDTKEINDRMDYGCFCYLGMIDQTPVGYYWIAKNKCYIPYLNGFIHLKADQRYGFNAVVSPDYRGQNIFNHMRSLIFSELKNEGVNSVIDAHMSWNTATQRANKKFGSDYLGSVSYGFILTKRFFHDNTKDINIEYIGSSFELYKRLFNKIMRNQNARTY